ncbi:MAG TPA: 30S ribosomal protein S20 [Pirellulaceae bacterium]|nr:30S ribosomal protein S20 [Pirellulaceae bacterium]
MPNIKSAAKRMRQSRVRQTRNRSAKSELKTLAKRVVAAVESNQLDKAADELKYASRRLDKAAARGIIHRNAAARKKSRLSRRLRAAKAK